MSNVNVRCADVRKTAYFDPFGTVETNRKDTSYKNLLVTETVVVGNGVTVPSMLIGDVHGMNDNLNVAVCNNMLFDVGNMDLFSNTNITIVANDTITLDAPNIVLPGNLNLCGGDLKVDSISSCPNTGNTVLINTNLNLTNGFGINNSAFINTNTLTVVDDASIGGDLFVIGNVSGNNGSFTNNLNVGNTLNVVNDIVVGDDITAGDRITAANLTITNAATITNLTVTNNSTLNVVTANTATITNLTVSNNSSTSNLTVTNNATINNATITNLDVTTINVNGGGGNLDLNGSINVNGNITIAEELIVGGNITACGSNQVLQISTIRPCGTTLTINGNLQVNNSLVVLANIASNNITTGNNATIGGNLIVSENLGVTGNITGANNLSINNNITADTVAAANYVGLAGANISGTGIVSNTTHGNVFASYNTNGTYNFRSIVGLNSIGVKTAGNQVELSATGIAAEVSIGSAVEYPTSGFGDWYWTSAGNGDWNIDGDLALFEGLTTLGGNELIDSNGTLRTARDENIFRVADNGSSFNEVYIRVRVHINAAFVAGLLANLGPTPWAKNLTVGCRGLRGNDIRSFVTLNFNSFDGWAPVGVGSGGGFAIIMEMNDKYAQDFGLTPAAPQVNGVPPAFFNNADNFTIQFYSNISSADAGGLQHVRFGGAGALNVDLCTASGATGTANNGLYRFTKYANL